MRHSSDQMMTSCLTIMQINSYQNLTQIVIYIYLGQWTSLMLQNMGEQSKRDYQKYELRKI